MGSSPHPPGATLLSFVMRLLGDAHAHGVRAHARNCRRCGHEVARLRHQSALMAFALEPVAPPPLLRDALLQASGEIHRLSPMAKRVGRLLGLGHKQSVALLTRLDQPRFWREEGKVWVLDFKGPFPGTFLRLASGIQAELKQRRADLTARSSAKCRLLMLQGSAVDEAGCLWRSGHAGWSYAKELTAQEGCDVILLLAPRRGANTSRVHHQKKPQRSDGMPRLKGAKNPETDGLH